MSLADLPDVLTVEEAAAVLRIGRSSAFEAVRRGEIPSVKIGRRVLVPRHRLEAMLGLGNDEGAAGQPRLREASTAWNGRLAEPY